MGLSVLCHENRSNQWLVKFHSNPVFLPLKNKPNDENSVTPFRRRFTWQKKKKIHTDRHIYYLYKFLLIIIHGQNKHIIE